MEDNLVFDLGTVNCLTSLGVQTFAALATKFYDPIGLISPVVMKFKLLSKIFV